MPDPTTDSTASPIPSENDSGLVNAGHEYTAGRAWPAEGARVGLVTCERCGAALLFDPATPFNVTERHDRWHMAVANAERWPG